MIIRIKMGVLYLLKGTKALQFLRDTCGIFLILLKASKKLILTDDILVYINAALGRV